MTHVLLVGAGYMAKEYAKILKALDVSFDVVGRGQENAEAFQKEMGVCVQHGGIEEKFDQSFIPSHAIVATTLENLEENTIFLLNQGITNILVEKPGAVTQEGIIRIATLAKEKGANVYIAYNRRFYASVIEAQKRIAEDGGLTSFLFEFTEWSHHLKDLNKSKFQFNNWFIGNSTHVIDTAFFFGGKPKEISTYVQSYLDWHPKGSIYAGSGITEKNILFSYHANWLAPGSWKLELLTNKNRYIFRPFEKLHVQKIGTVDIEEIPLNNNLDIQFKPGLYKQINAFFNMNDTLNNHLLSITDSVGLFSFYEKMNGLICN
ncbi:Gfo/Idh/MocA family oxidoreductase [Lysinibacillus pakistanensis]|uniref:Gfo/Idh/MocA family protein n=1 Tax=Lysinibacillus pakistanensis TaxID=759811 RepID=UPI003D2D8B20